MLRATDLGREVVLWLFGAVLGLPTEFPLNLATGGGAADVEAESRRSKVDSCASLRFRAAR
jgi:hypothetical protein